MAFEKKYDTPEVFSNPACVHLRNKAMCVTGQMESAVPKDEEGSQYCWCNITQHILGPDQQDVNRRDCTCDRGCYCNVR